jgi:hypothetical protein
MSEPAVHVRLQADVAAEPSEAFTFFTEHFDEVWPGKMTELGSGSDAAEPKGLGFRRRIKPPGMPGHLEEEITVHRRPELIEYRVINDDSPITNHVGRIRFSPRAGGTRIDYTIDFDYSPKALGAVAAGVMKTSWALKSKRVLRGRLGDPGS